MILFHQRSGHCSREILTAFLREMFFADKMPVTRATPQIANIARSRELNAAKWNRSNYKLSAKRILIWKVVLNHVEIPLRVT